MTNTKKRLSSLAWRAGMMGLAAILDYAVTSLTEFSIPPELVVVIGLVLGEISKQIKNEVQLRKEIKELETL